MLLRLCNRARHADAVARWRQSSTATHASSLATSFRKVIVPERSLWQALFWRSVRVGRVAFLAGTIYQAGKASGHVDVLEDPDGVAKQVVMEIIESSHQSSNPKKKPGWHKRGSKLHRRVDAVGQRVLDAARDEVVAQLAALETSQMKVGVDGESRESKEVEAKREALQQAHRRLRGTWHFVVCLPESTCLLRPHYRHDHDPDSIAPDAA